MNREPPWFALVLWFWCLFVLALVASYALFSGVLVLLR